MYNKGITQFYLPSTHEPYLPLLPEPHGVTALGWYSLHLPTKGWPG